MASQSNTNKEFSKRNELLAGKVLGNLSGNELALLAEQHPLSAEEQSLLKELKSAHNHREHHCPPPLSEAVKQRLLNSASNARTSNPERWIIAGLLFILTLTGVELYRSKLKLAQQTSTWPAVALQAEDRAIALHATKPGAMNQAHAEVVIRPDQGSNLLRVNHLPQAPQGRVYRLWALTPDGVKGCVHFLPDQQGRIEMSIPPQPTGSATELLISLDPLSFRESVDRQPEEPVLTSAI